jgi:hypothetical protein
MSTVTEIKSAIERLAPEDFLALEEWMRGRTAGMAERRWSPEELSAGARQMVAEPDPIRAQALWERTAAGFYGDANA